MRDVSYDEVKTELEVVVAERGEDYQYPDEWRNDDGSCRYVTPDGTGPACIAGAVYFRLGVGLDFLRQHEGDGSTTVDRDLMHEGVLHLTDKASLLLRFAQIGQDKFHSWGESVRNAVEKV